MEMVEAVALFDYNGRTNKELSFKTNQIIYIYKKINPQWWLGHIAGKNQSGFIPDGYIKLKSKFVLQFLLFILREFFIFRRRDSAPIQHPPLLSIAPNQSSSLKSINLPTSSNDKHNPPIPTHRPIYDLLPPSPPLLTSTTDHSSSSSHSTSIIDIDTTLCEVLSKECHAQFFRPKLSQQEIDAPDLVLNLPISKSFDEHIPIVHSTIIIDLERKKIPPPIMKKPEKTMQLIKRLGLQQHSISISGSSKATEV